MKKATEILKRCTQFEELASFGIEPISLEHPNIPPPPPIPMEFRPTEFAPAPPTIPGALWDTAPTDRTPAAQTMRSPEFRPETPEVRPPAPEVKPPAAEPEKPAIKASDIKFDENGEVVIPREWYNEKGKLVVDKRQLAQAIYDARKAKIISAKVDAARSKVLAREMRQVNSMVKSIAFREKLPARTAIGLLSAAALTAAYYIFSDKKPQTTDPIKTEVVSQTASNVGASSWEKPTPVTMSALIRDLKDALLFVQTGSRQEKQALQNYSTMLDNINASIAKLSGTVLNLDQTPSATSYANEVQKFDKMAVDAVTKLEKLATALRARNDASDLDKVQKVISGLEAYIVSINNARTIKQG